MSNNPWRLYRPEWVIAHTVTMSTTDPANAVEAAKAWAADNLKGRVRDSEIKLEVGTGGVMLFWCHVKVFKDTLKGEFKYPGNATTYAKVHGYEEYVIVERNSPDDQKIRSYGAVVL